MLKKSLGVPRSARAAIRLHELLAASVEVMPDFVSAHLALGQSAEGWVAVAAHDVEVHLPLPLQKDCTQDQAQASPAAVLVS